MDKKKLKNIREKGDGAGITYAMIWFTIMIAFIIMVFVQFNSNIYLAKAEMETGLHIIEGSVMVRSQKFYDGKYKDDYERDLQRAHIITSDIQTTKLESGKRIESYVGGTACESQCKKIGNEITKSLQDQFFLDSNNVPTGGAIALLSSGRVAGTKMYIDGDVLIYEPIYSYEVKRTATVDASHPWEFTEAGTIVGWKKYVLHFNDNNEYTGVTPEPPVTTTPKLKNGDLCEGATIEMTIKIDFYGINKIFADAASSTGNKHTVYVTQSTDIVLVNLDSRTVH